MYLRNAIVPSLFVLVWTVTAHAQSKTLPPTPLLDKLAKMKQAQAEAPKAKESENALLENRIKQLEERDAKSHSKFSQTINEMWAQLDATQKRELELERKLAKSVESTVNPKPQPSNVASASAISPLHIGLLLSWKLPCGCNAQLHNHHDGIYFFHGKQKEVKLLINSQPSPGWSLFTILSDGLTEVYANPSQEHYQIVRPIR